MLVKIIFCSFLLVVGSFLIVQFLKTSKVFRKGNKVKGRIIRLEKVTKKKVSRRSGTRGMDTVRYVDYFYPVFVFKNETGKQMEERSFYGYLKDSPQVEEELTICYLEGESGVIIERDYPKGTLFLQVFLTSVLTIGGALLVFFIFP